VDAMNKEMDKMLEKGIITPSDSPWASPVVLIKKNSGELRFCVDYRKVNEQTKKDAYPLPRIDETLEAVSGSEYFCVMDLASGFWQVEVSEEDKQKTAFCTRRGLFEFNVMSFGLCNAPSTFARLMSNVLKGMTMSEVLVYIDDLLVHGKSFSATMASLREVFTRLRTSGLKLKASKCQFFKQSVKYLGHVITKEGISCDPAKVEAIRDWSIPKSVKEVRAVLGTASYYRKFIQNFASLASPLNALLHKGVKFQWSNQCQQAFELIKFHLTTAPILAFPTDEGEYILDTDACDHGVGAVLSQLQNGQEKVIAYASRTLSSNQQVYCTTFKELLAVRIFVEHFRVYLYGRKFTVRTDHASLRWLKNFDKPEGMAMRWITYLDTFDIEWQHRRGVSHGNADGLSRKPPTRRCRCKECSDCGNEVGCVKAVGEADEVEVVNQIGSGETEEKQIEEEFSNWLEHWPKTQLSSWQQSDPDLALIMPMIGEGKSRPPYKSIQGESRVFKSLWALWNELQIIEGVLYRMKHCEEKISPILQCVAPTEIRTFILEQLHNSRLAGHLGVSKTIDRVKQRFYWPGYRDDIILWCKKCVLCAQTSKRSNKAVMKHELASEPLQRVGIDIVGPLPKTEQGNSFIMVICDYYTRWVEAYSIPDQTAITVADKFVTEFVCRFGVPQKLHSDQGTDFMSSLFKQMCKLLEIEQTRTTPYRPCSNGLTERMNQTIQHMLSAFVNDYRNDWEDHLPFVLMAYRAAVQESTGCSPNLLMLGREVLAPIDLMLGREPVPETDDQCYVEYVEWLKLALSTAFDFSRGRMKYSVARQQQNYNRRAREGQIKEGMWVWYHYLPKARMKLSKFWQGPYLVVDKISDVTFRIHKASWRGHGWFMLMISKWLIQILFRRIGSITKQAAHPKLWRHRKRLMMRPQYSWEEVRGQGVPLTVSLLNEFKIMIVLELCLVNAYFGHYFF